MAEENNKQEQPAEENAEQAPAGDEALTSAVKSLVENAVIEARARSQEKSVTFIEIEEEPLPAARHPLRSTTAAAGGGIKSAGGTTFSAAKSITAWAISVGKASASTAEKIARAAVDYVQEEDVIERAADLLQEAEAEGKQAVENISALLTARMDKRNSEENG